jgi:hypothetical protein
LHGLLSSGGAVPTGVVDKIRKMSDEVFFESLDTFSSADIHKSLHKSLSNHFFQNMHKNERIDLFLEKKRTPLDLKSFAFNGKNSFLGNDVLVPQNDHSPISFYISGTLDESNTKYFTDGLTFGLDYTQGKDLTGFNIHFKNKPLETTVYKSDESNEYHFNFYKSYRGHSYFMDYTLGAGSYSKDVQFDNIWGNWRSQTHTSQALAQSRLGIYKTDNTQFNIAYVGLSGAYSSIDPFTSKTTDSLGIYADQSTLLSLDGQIGAQVKTKIHIENIVIEPSIQASISIPLYESYKTPSHHFGISQSSFNCEPFSIDKSSFFYDFTVRMFAFKNTILKISVEGVKQWEESNSKVFLGIDVRF